MSILDKVRNFVLSRLNDNQGLFQRGRFVGFNPPQPSPPPSQLQFTQSKISPFSMIGNTINTGLSNIRGNLQAIFNPQTRATWFRGFTPQLPQPIQQPISNLRQNVRLLANPKTAGTFIQGFEPKNKIGGWIFRQAIYNPEEKQLFPMGFIANVNRIAKAEKLAKQGKISKKELADIRYRELINPILAMATPLKEKGGTQAILEAEGLGVKKAKPASPPLSPTAENIGRGEGKLGNAKALKGIKTPKTIGMNQAETDPFIKQLEQAQERIAQEPKLNTLPTDTSAQYEATIKGGGFTGEVHPEVKQAFADWVNQRRAVKVEGLLKQKEFADLNSQGIEGFTKFQSGKPTGRLADVKKYFDAKYQQVKDTGIDVRYKKFYLPQLWENTDEEIAKVFGRTLGTRPSFSLQSLIKNYQEGIKLGLTPRYKTIGELVGWYEKTANKAIADKNFFDYLAKEGLIQPSNKAPRDWITLNPDAFPKIKVNIPGKTEYVGTFKAPRELGEMINNYLSTPDTGNLAQRVLSSIANYVSDAKNRLLSFGIPNTGLNFHGFNILVRSFLEGGPKGALKTAYYMINPRAAGKYVEQNLSKSPDAIKSGLSLSTHEFASSLESDNLVSKFGKKWNDLFEKPLFENIIVAKKIEGWDKLWREYAKDMPIEQAKREAAKFINNVYGGINWEQLGRNRDIQNIFRIIALTPDWLESNIRLGGNMIKSSFDFRNPMGKAYRRAMTYFLGSYVVFNFINKLTSGHYMWQNDPGHTFEIEAGYTSDGQKRYVRPYGTAVDFARIPIDIAISLIKGDPTPLFRAIANRLSVVASPIVHLLGNVNWAGQPIYGRTKYGKEIPPLQSMVNIGAELGTAVGFPSFLGQALRGLTGQQGIEQSLLQGFELPVRYSGGYFSPSDKKVAEALGVLGKERYDLSQQLKNQASFSPNQLKAIQLGGKDFLNQIIQQREKNKQIEELKKQVEEGRVKNLQQVGNYIPIVTKEGKVDIIDLTFQPKPPILTGNELLDKKTISKYKSEVNKKANDIYALYEAGIISAQEAEKQLADLKTKASKYAKPKKLKQLFKIKAPSLKLSRLGKRIKYTKFSQVVKGSKGTKGKKLTLKDLLPKTKNNLKTLV